MSDTEYTGDSAFRGVAADHLREATAKLTAAIAAEEDDASPDEPQPDHYPPESA